MSIFGDVFKAATSFLPGGGLVSGGVDLAGDLFGGGASSDTGDCPNQTPTETARKLVAVLSPTDRTTLAAAWSKSVKSMPIPWYDPRKLAQQARGGDGCTISGDDHYFADAWYTMLARYQGALVSSSIQATPVPATAVQPAPGPPLTSPAPVGAETLTPPTPAFGGPLLWVAALGLLFVVVLARGAR